MSNGGKLDCTLIDALVNRRSRRFLQGMKMPSGPLQFESRQEAVPLTEEEEATLAFAACGITGFALGDLNYARGEGGTIMANFVGRTIPSGDAINSVSLIVTNDEATYWIKRPQDMTTADVRDLAALAKERRFVEIYRQSRVKIKDGRSAPPVEQPHNLPVNRWSLYARGASYFLPVMELTYLYINALLEIFGEWNGYWLIDERNRFKPAGIGRFAKSKGGHLNDDMSSGRAFTVQILESHVSEFIATEQGMAVQNIALTAHALGLGGFPHWAAHPSAWFEEVGFDCRQMPVPRFLGMSEALTKVAGLMGRKQTLPVVERLRRGGKDLFKAYCPPCFPNMREAVMAVVEQQFGENGTYRRSNSLGSWKSPKSVLGKAEPPSKQAIEATIAYCEYIYSRYGRFPCYPMPFKTLLGFQAGRVESSFYEEYYDPAVGEFSKPNATMEPAMS